MIKNKISVCIATYKRPDLLEKLLISIINQKGIDEHTIEFVIVDNDNKWSAKDTVDKIRNLIQDNIRFSIIYSMQPEKNISLTRNKTLELATGKFIFFIDDDEYADELCIYNHINVINQFKGDVSIGSVLPYYKNTVPLFIQDCDVFRRINFENGASSKFFITGNTMIKKEALTKFNIQFDPAYGLTGGEDNDFFSKIKKKGGGIISCNTAIAFEFIPDQKANLKSLINRVFRTGNNYTRTLINSNKKKVIIALSQIIKGIAQFLIAIFIALFLLPINRTKSLNWFLKSVSNIAKPFAVIGYYPKSYK